MTLNIKHDLPNHIWEVILPKIYKSLEGWKGYSETEDNKGIPYWFSFDEQEKHVWASIEPSGLLFEGLMLDEEWERWKLEIKRIATQELRDKVGEIELGEVD